MKWKIGNIEIKNQVTLAPIAGVSNFTYMKICEDMGVSYAVTELISAEAIVRKNKKTFDMFNGLNKLNIPFAVQIFGYDPDKMAQAAKIIEDTIHPNVIDINMGCPVPKVAIKNKSGSYLMKTPEVAYKIVKAVVDNTNIPVTVKIRSGWDEKSINAVEIAKLCSSAGASAIFVHPRTRKQGYSGLADWSIIKDVVDNVNVPVIGNGDIKTCYDAKKMLDETGCKAVMIGRGVLGNPWLIKDTINYLEYGLKPKEVSITEKIAMMKKNINELVKNKGEFIGVLEMRTQLMYYLKGISNTKELKKDICKASNKDELIEMLNKFEKNIME